MLLLVGHNTPYKRLQFFTAEYRCNFFDIFHERCTYFVVNQNLRYHLGRLRRLSSSLQVGTCGDTRHPGDEPGRLFEVH